MDERHTWQRLLSILMDEEKRRLYARIVLSRDGAAPVLPHELDRAQVRTLRSLVAGGLVEITLDGRAVERPAVFADILASTQTVDRGVERFLENGRLERSPSRIGDLRQVLEHLAATMLSAGETVTEKCLMERLGPLASDPVGRRREMVELGILDRARDGSSYWLRQSRSASSAPTGPGDTP